MKGVGVRRDTDHAVILTSDGQMKLEVIRPHIIRVIYTRREQFNDRKSLMMLPRKSGSSVAWTVTENDSTVMLATDHLHLEIDRETSAFTWRDGHGNLLVREPRGGSKVLEEIEVTKAVYDCDTKISTVQSVDGMKAVAENVRRVVDRTAYSTTLRLQFSEDEAIYGLGQHEEGVLNYRGRQQYLYQQNMKVAAPMIVSTRGYGIVWDTYSLATFHDDQHGTYFWTEIDDEMDFYFIYGPEFDQIMAGCRSLTGQVPMLPRWAYGYFQSKERYKTSDELVDVVREYRRRKIPIDCIVQDWMTWPGEQWGQKSFDPSRFPDPKKLCDELHALDTKLMVSIWPIMRNEGPNQLEMRQSDFLLGNDATYDAFDPSARALYWKQTEAGYFRHGVDSWWADCTEPFESDWNGSVKPQPERRVVINTEEAKKYLDPGYINAYSLLHSQGLYEGQRLATADKRVVVLTRSAFLGQQRYGTVTWSGDTAATWATLRRQIADGLNFCVTGNPRWTFDIGAFFVGQKEQWFWRGDYPEGCADEGYRELYVRWFQLGAFLPMFRSHGTDTPREVWRFGQPGDTTYDTLVNFINLRYRLLPYIYSLAASETLGDYTMLRMLAFDFRHDPNVYDIKDQFMFGRAFLVCPVTEPMYFTTGSRRLEGTPKNRKVYLPAGCDWYDFWTGKSYAGSQTITADAPLDVMPLFVRAGSIIPMGPLVQHSGEALDAPIELRIYGGANASFNLYEDENDNYNYEQGASATIPITWDQKQLRVGDRRGEYRGMALQRTFRAVWVRPGHGVGLLVKPPDEVLSYSGKQIETEYKRKE